MTKSEEVFEYYKSLTLGELIIIADNPGKIPQENVGHLVECLEIKGAFREAKQLQIAHNNLQKSLSKKGLEKENQEYLKNKRSIGFWFDNKYDSSIFFHRFKPKLTFIAIIILFIAVLFALLRGEL